MLDLLAWLLQGSSRPEYAAAQGGRVSAEPRPVGLLLVLVALRCAFNAAFRRPLARLAQARGRTAHHRDGGKLLEEVWILLGNLVLLAAAMRVMLRSNGGCSFLDTRTCLAGWPAHATQPEARLYYQAELAWYCHLLLKNVLGARYGLPDGASMLLHHCATIALILLSYAANLTRIGVVVLSVFALSNPLLHVAKICNQLSLGPLRVAGFAAFGAAFFLSRVLLVPWAVLKPAALDSRRDAPYIKEDFPGIWWGANALLALLYAMQLVWFNGIIRVLRSAVREGSDAAGRMSDKLDPAKRYSAEHGPHAVHDVSTADADMASPSDQKTQGDGSAGSAGGAGSKANAAGLPAAAGSPEQTPPVALRRRGAGE